MKRSALVAVAAVVSVAASLAHGEDLRIGVMLPLTGPASAAGKQASAVLGKMLDEKLLLIVDSRGSEEGAGAALKSLQEKNVKLVIGPLLSAELQAVLKARPTVPVASLVSSLTPEASKNAFSANVLTLTQSRAQFNALINPKILGGKIVVASTEVFAPKGNQIVASMSANTIDKQLVLTPLSEKGAESLSKIAIDKGATIASFADNQTATTLQQGLTIFKGKGIIMSPPPPQYTAGIISNLVLGWLAQKERTPSSWVDVVTRSQYFDKESTSVPVDWNVTARGIDFVAYASTSGSKTCRCSSEDGMTARSTPCQDPPNTCQPPTQTKTDCTCPCGPK